MSYNITHLHITVSIHERKYSAYADTNILEYQTFKINNWFYDNGRLLFPPFITFNLLLYICWYNIRHPSVFSIFNQMLYSNTYKYILCTDIGPENHFDLYHSLSNLYKNPTTLLRILITSHLLTKTPLLPLLPVSTDLGLRARQSVIETIHRERPWCNTLLGFSSIISTLQHPFHNPEPSMPSVRSSLLIATDATDQGLATKRYRLAT
jgi:hypothetical protein